MGERRLGSSPREPNVESPPHTRFIQGKFGHFGRRKEAHPGTNSVTQEQREHLMSKEKGAQMWEQDSTTSVCSQHHNKVSLE